MYLWHSARFTFKRIEGKSLTVNANTPGNKELEAYPDTTIIQSTCG